MKKFVSKIAGVLFMAAIAGTLVISDVRAEELDEDLEVSVESTDEAASEILEDGIIDNKTMKLNTPMRDTIRNTTRYKFSIPKSGRLTLQAGFDEGTPDLWYQLGSYCLYDCDGREVRSMDIWDDDPTPDMGEFSAEVVAGDYYIEVTCCGDQGNVYVIMQLNYEPVAETVVDSLMNKHNSVANPIKLPFNKKYTEHLAENGDSDVFSVKNKKNQFITVKLATRTNGCRFKMVNNSNTVNIDEWLYDKSGNFRVFCPKGTYYITISNRDGELEYYGSYTISVAASAISKAKISKVTWNKPYREIKVKYPIKSVENSSGYEIQYCTNKKFKKGAKIETVWNSESLQSTVNISVPKKGTYYVRIRNFMTDNREERYYSAWSAVKKVKVKR